MSLRLFFFVIKFFIIRNHYEITFILEDILSHMFKRLNVLWWIFDHLLILGYFTTYLYGVLPLTTERDYLTTLSQQWLLNYYKVLTSDLNKQSLFYFKYSLKCRKLSTEFFMSKCCLTWTARYLGRSIPSMLQTVRLFMIHRHPSSFCIRFDRVFHNLFRKQLLTFLKQYKILL